MKGGMHCTCCGQPGTAAAVLIQLACACAFSTKPCPTCTAPPSPSPLQGFTKAKRTENVLCETACEMLRIAAEDMQDLLDQYPRLLETLRKLNRARIHKWVGAHIQAWGRGFRQQGLAGQGEGGPELGEDGLERHCRQPGVLVQGTWALTAPSMHACAQAARAALGRQSRGRRRAAIRLCHRHGCR